jgi:ribosomal protein S27E
MKRLIFLISIANLFLICYSNSWDNSKSITSTNFIELNKLRIDSDSNIIAICIFNGTINDLNPVITSYSNSDDFLIIKYDKNLNILWKNQIGSRLKEIRGSLAIDSENNIYVLGSSQGNCKFSNEDSIINESDPNKYDVFLAKYSSEGNFIWGKNIVRGNNQQLSLNIDVDRFDSIILTGVFLGSAVIEDDTLTGNSYFTNFISKFDTTGNNKWNKIFLGSHNTDKITSVATLNDGYYFSGNFTGIMEFDIDTLVNEDSGTDAFVYKTDFDGKGQWIRRSYGVNNQGFGSVIEDEHNAVYFTGYFESSTVQFDSTQFIKSNTTLKKVNGSDILIAKYNKNGTFLWAKSYGGSFNDWTSEIWESNGFLYVAGYFTHSITIGSTILTSTSTSNIDGFLAIFNSNGNPVRAESIIGYGNYPDIGNTIIMDNEVNAYIAGSFSGDSIRIGDSVYTNPVSGNKQAFIAKYIPPYSAVFSKVQPISCHNQANGSLTVTPYFGVPPYTYTWSHNPGLNDSVAAGLTAQVYHVEVRDARDSVAIISYNLTQPALLNLELDSTATTCYNGNNGSIALTVSGGTPAYTYEWTGGTGVSPSTQDQSNLVSGWFFVDVTDANGCEARDSIFVPQPDKIIFKGSTVQGNTPIDTGAVNLNVTGGTPAYTYSWAGPSAFVSTEKDIDSLPGGAYEIVVTDANSCVSDTTFVITEENGFVAYISSHSHVTCRGDANGSATVSIANGSGLHNFQWTDSAGTKLSDSSSVSGLQGGWYFVEVGDFNGGDFLYSYDSILIVEAAAHIAINKSVVNPSCHGGNNGLVDVQVAGGIPNYSYVWSNGKTTEDLTSLSFTGDTLYIEVTDAHGCKAQNWVYIGQPDPIQVDVSLVQPVTCQNTLTGSLYAFISGGNSPYTFQWNDPGSQTEQLATDLGKGLYSVTVTDKTGCQNVGSYNLPNPGLLSIDTIIGYDPLCNGEATGAIKADVNGGSGIYTYTWGHTALDSDTLAGQQAGNFTLTVNDETCNETDNGVVSLNDPDSITITNADITHVACFGQTTGAITLNVSGGSSSYNYIWGHVIDNTPTVTGLGYGSYNVTVNDVNCSDDESAVITINQSPELQIASIDSIDVTCHDGSDGSILITPTGGSAGTNYRFEWGHQPLLDDSLATNLGYGTYGFTVYDDFCGASVGGSVNIDQPEPLEFAFIHSTDIICNGDNDGSIVVTPSGGSLGSHYRYNWSHNPLLDDSVATALPADQYTVKVFDDVCNDSILQTIYIQEPNALAILSATSLDVTCFGGTNGQAIVTPAGGHTLVNYRFEWLHNPLLTDSIASGLPAGDYTVTVYDDLCSDQVMELISVNEPAPLSVLHIDSTDVTCHGGSDGQIVVTPAGGATHVNYRFAWSHNPALDDSIANGLSAGNYQVTVYDPVCSDSVFTTVNIEESSAFSVQLAYSDVSCNGAADAMIAVTPSGGSGNTQYRYEWLHDPLWTDSLATGLEPGAYSITVFDDICGLDDVVNVNISGPNALSISSIEKINVTCFGGNNGSIIAVPTGGSFGVNYRFDWGHDAQRDDSTATGLTAGNYTVTVFDDACGDQVEETIAIGQPAALSLQISQQISQLDCHNDNDGAITAVASGGSGDYSYEWSHNGGLSASNATGLIAGTYDVTVTDNICNETANQVVEITEPDSILIDSVVVIDKGVSTAGEILIYASGGTGNLLFAINGANYTEDFVFDDLNLGDYVVQITDVNGCGPISTGNIKITTGINSLDLQQVKLYPVPAGQHINVAFEKTVEFDKNLKLFNSLGHLVWEGMLPAGHNKQMIGLQGVPQGVYYIMIDNQHVTQPIVIQRD